jgi:hypothetical protein
MCDLFALCHHTVEDVDVADQREPGQWNIFLVPVVGPLAGITKAELDWASQKMSAGGRQATLQRKPGTLEKGIRGRQPNLAISITDLAIDNITACLGI